MDINYGIVMNAKLSNGATTLGPEDEELIRRIIVEELERSNYIARIEKLLGENAIKKTSVVSLNKPKPEVDIFGQMTDAFFGYMRNTAIASSPSYLKKIRWTYAKNSSSRVEGIELNTIATLDLPNEFRDEWVDTSRDGYLVDVTSIMPKIFEGLFADKGNEDKLIERDETIKQIYTKLDNNDFYKKLVEYDRVGEVKAISFRLKNRITRYL